MAKRSTGKPEQRKPEKTYQRRWANQYSQVWTDATIERLADDMLEWFQKKENIWLKDFSVERMVHFQRFDEWADRNGYFGFVFSFCKAMQESKLVRLGLSKNFNASMPIFALKNVAGWRDVRELTGPEGQPLIPQAKDPFNELAKVCLAVGVTFSANDDGNGSEKSTRSGKAGTMAKGAP
jgi:hypothetical protein